MVQALEGELVDRAAGPPDVVHFIGHAAPHPDPKKRDGIELYLEDAKGLFYPLAAPGLAKMIAESQALVDGPRLVVLNACQTAQVDGSQTLVGLVPELVTRTGVMAVIGMQFKVGDDAAATFSAVLYSQLLDTQPLDYAVARARSAMSEYGGHDWAAPVLYMQVADGMIYEP
jgi:CHAT domain-containing protein